MQLYNITLFCTVTVLDCTELYHIILYYTLLPYNCTVLYGTVLNNADRNK